MDGELWVRGSSVMQGYYKMPAETAETLEDGWLKPGSGLCGRGWICLPDRPEEDLIITKNGENVSPEELENALSTNRLVGEVLVREKGGVIEAEIYPDQDYVKKKRIKDVKAKCRRLLMSITGRRLRRKNLQFDRKRHGIRENDHEEDQEILNRRESGVSFLTQQRTKRPFREFLSDGEDSRFYGR